MNHEGFPGHFHQIRIKKQGRPSRGRNRGVTYGRWLEVGGRTVEGGWVASLDSYTTQHVQQYLSVRAFNVNTKHTKARHAQVRRAQMPTHTDSCTMPREGM